MGPDDVTAWTNAIGPTLVAVIALAVVIIPMLQRNKSEGPKSDTAVAVKLENHEGRIAAHDKRLDALEKKGA